MDFIYGIIVGGLLVYALLLIFCKKFIKTMLMDIEMPKQSEDADFWKPDGWKPGELEE